MVAVTHEILAAVTGDLEQRIQDTHQLRHTIQVENAKRTGGYRQKYLAWQDADAAWQLNPTVGPKPTRPDPPELLPDRTVWLLEQLQAQRDDLLRGAADRIEAQARAREKELVTHAREVAAQLRPAVDELNQLLLGLRQVRLAVQNSEPGVFPVDGPADRTPASVDVIDLLVAATRGAALLAPVAATVDPQARPLVDRDVVLVPEPLPNGNVRLVYGTRRGG